MGSSLGSSISKFYVCHIENEIFKTMKKHKIYVLYVDDIFIATQSYNKITKLKRPLQKNSILKLTIGLIKGY